MALVERTELVLLVLRQPQSDALVPRPADVPAKLLDVAAQTRNTPGVIVPVESEKSSPACVSPLANRLGGDGATHGPEAADCV